jgi:hypothetical protein
VRNSDVPHFPGVGFQTPSVQLRILLSEIRSGSAVLKKHSMTAPIEELRFLRVA